MGLTDMLQDAATKEKLQDFAERYDQGKPWEGISDDEAREQYDQVAPQLDDREYEESARESFERLDEWLEPYRRLWARHLDALERHLDSQADLSADSQEQR